MRSSSASSNAPTTRPSRQTKTLSAERQDARRKARAGPIGGLMAAEDQLMGADPHVADHRPCLRGPDPMTSCTCSGTCRVKTAAGGGGYDGGSHNVLRSLLQRAGKRSTSSALSPAPFRQQSDARRRR